MTYEEFARRAQSVYEEIPASFKEGVDGVEVTRRAVLHPTLPEIYTLGECLSEHYPSDFGGAGEIRSTILLHYGSFLELSRRDEEWDWDEEIFETLTHELRHHLEHLASDDSLGDFDWVEDQNFARREGRPFDPLFYRGGREAGAHLYEVDGDYFLEVSGRRSSSDEGSFTVKVGGAHFQIRKPLPQADVHYLRFPEPPIDDEGDFYLVLAHGSGFAGWLGRLFGRGRPAVLEGEAEVISG